MTLRSMGKPTVEETCAIQDEIICPQFLKLGANNLCWLSVYVKVLQTESFSWSVV